MTKRIHKSGCITDSWYFLPEYYTDTEGDSYQLQRKCNNQWCINKAHAAYKLFRDKGLSIDYERRHKPNYPPERRAYIRTIKEDPASLFNYYDTVNSYIKTAKEFNVSKSFVRELVVSRRN
jgi:hypothetical protein